MRGVQLGEARDQQLLDVALLAVGQRDLHAVHALDGDGRSLVAADGGHARRHVAA